MKQILTLGFVLIFMSAMVDAFAGCDITNNPPPMVGVCTNCNDLCMPPSSANDYFPGSTRGFAFLNQYPGQPVMCYWGSWVTIYSDFTCDVVGTLPSSSDGLCVLLSLAQMEVICPSFTRNGNIPVIPLGDCHCNRGPCQNVGLYLNFDHEFFAGPAGPGPNPVPEFSVVGVGVATFLIGLVGGMFMQKKKK